MSPYPDWLNPGDNAWQLVAATLVGLMSLPGIAVRYGGIVQKKWAVNTIWMALSTWLGLSGIGACRGHCQLEQSEGDFRRFASAIHQVACDV